MIRLLLDLLERYVDAIVFLTLGAVFRREVFLGWTATLVGLCHVILVAIRLPRAVATWVRTWVGGHQARGKRRGPWGPMV